MKNTPESVPVNIRGASEISRKYTELMHRTAISYAIMTSALEVPKSLGSVKEQVFQNHLGRESGLSKIFEQGVLKGFTRERDQEFFAKAMAAQTAINAEMVISAAVIVLSHSTADDVFTGACQLAMDLDPKRWMAELNLDKKVTLREIDGKSVDEVFGSELAVYRSKVGAKSLPTRADLLFRYVKIRHNRNIPSTSPEYFRTSELIKADNLRKEIVHGGMLPQIAVSKAFGTTIFLHEAAITAMRSIASAYPLGVDEAHWQELGREQNPGRVFSDEDIAALKTGKTTESKL